MESYRIMAAIIMVLEFFCLIALFKGVLGYRLHENITRVVAGITLIAFTYVLQQWIIPNGGKLLFWSQILMPAAGIMLMFSGKKKVSFAIAASMMCVYEMMYTFFLGMMILHNPEKMGDLNLNLICGFGVLNCLLVIIILTILFRNKRRLIRKHTDEINVIVLWLFVAFHRISIYKPWSIGDRIGFNQEIIHGKNLVIDGLLTFVVIFTFVLVCMLISQKKTLKRTIYLNDKCIREQTEQYSLLSKRDRELRKFRHDYNAHITALHSMAERGEMEKILHYIESLTEIKPKTKLICTNNIICDAILNQYAALCQEENIQIEIKGKLPEHFSVRETDLCVILSNGIQNAYEAARKCGSERKPHIWVEFTNEGIYTNIMIRNSTERELKISEGIPVSSKGDKENHGFGTRNILETVEKYEGNVTWDYNDSRREVITDILLRTK